MKNLYTFILFTTSFLSLPCQGQIDNDLMEFSVINFDNLNDSLIKEKFNVISFVASWCKPCIVDLPKMIELKNELKDKVNFIFVWDNHINKKLFSKFKDTEKTYVLDSNIYKGTIYKNLKKIRKQLTLHFKYDLSGFGPGTTILLDKDFKVAFVPNAEYKEDQIRKFMSEMK